MYRVVLGLHVRAPTVLLLTRLVRAMCNVGLAARVLERLVNSSILQVECYLRPSIADFPKTGLW